MTTTTQPVSSPTDWLNANGINAEKVRASYQECLAWAQSGSPSAVVRALRVASRLGPRGDWSPVSRDAVIYRALQNRALPIEVRRFVVTYWRR